MNLVSEKNNVQNKSTNHVRNTMSWPHRVKDHDKLNLRIIRNMYIFLYYTSFRHKQITVPYYTRHGLF